MAVKIKGHRFRTFSKKTLGIKETDGAKIKIKVTKTERIKNKITKKIGKTQPDQPAD